MPVPSQESELSCICVYGVLILSLSRILLLIYCSNSVVFFCFSIYLKMVGWNCRNYMWIKQKRFKFMLLNATFNNISVILWWSILLMEETGIPRENNWPVASHWQTSSHNVASSTPGLKLTTLVVIDTDYAGIYKSNYHTIMTTTTAHLIINL